MTETIEKEAGPHAGGPADRLGYVLLALWICGAGLFFFLRFSFQFYYANELLLQRLFGR